VPSTSRLRAFLWKELREYTRDVKAVVITVVVPPLALIAIGLVTVLLAVQRPLAICVVDLDAGGYSKTLAQMLRDYLAPVYVVVESSNLTAALRDPAVDLIVVIPEGFSRNATSFERVAFVRIIKRAGISGEQIDMAESRVKSVVSAFSAMLSESKIAKLAEIANITVNTKAVRDPVQVEAPVYIGVHGEPARVEDVWRPFIARILILSISFIVTPASTYIIDGVIGERERKTMEMLLASPLGLTEFLLVKTIAASIVGLLAALSDLLGLYTYTIVLASLLGGFILGVVDPGLIALHAVVSFLTILATISISLPFISRTKGVKSASSVATLISTLGVALFISGWVVDFYKLPRGVLGPLLLVPYTHSVLAIQAYVYGDYSLVAGSVITLSALSVVLIYASTRVLDREKVLLAQTYYE
jgi:ABC-2 type transport system permease protein